MSASDKSKCESLLGSLSDYVDGSLSEDFCAELERHLAECQDCRVVVDTLRKTVYLYHENASEPAEVPDAVRERLFRCLNLDDYAKH
ncbi:MAG TPA: zf-HC2 domain-containing protein [Anaerolineales bacterium]|nr:zf-HC2 domain-containing protein [Anaerolineales bacterium]